MKGNHEFNIRQGLCLVMIGLISVVEAALISAPPLSTGENLRVFVDCQSWARGQMKRLDQNQEKWMSPSAFEQDYRSISLGAGAESGCGTRLRTCRRLDAEMLAIRPALFDRQRQLCARA